MAKITLDNVSSGFQSTSVYNANMDLIETDLNTKVLYRNNPTGEVNQMENDLDMNSNDILNTGDVASSTFTLAGVAVTTSNLTAFSVPVRAIDGTAADPAYTFTDNTDLGLFSPDTDILGIATAGLERLRVDATGNTGIGQSTPAAKLDIKQTGTAKSLFVDQDGEGIAVDIDSEAVTSDVLSISPAVLTTGKVIDVPDADSLTTGSIASLVSDSSDVTARDLVQITNDNTLATGATCLSMQQDAANHLMDMNLGTLDTGFVDFVATADADATSAISTLTTSGSTTHHIQIEINGITAWIAVSTTDPS